MTIPNPEHLLEQAEWLLAAPAAGPPRQVDLRRAISAAYYALFHAILTAAADEFVGVTQRSTKRYSLVYRSIDHARLRLLCEEVQKPTLTARFAEHAPNQGFGRNIQHFSIAFVDLQKRRHAADYDPLARFNRSDASLAVDISRAALRRFRQASRIRRKTFLSLLVFQPRAPG